MIAHTYVRSFFLLYRRGEDRIPRRRRAAADPEGSVSANVVQVPRPRPEAKEARKAAQRNPRNGGGGGQRQQGIWHRGEPPAHALGNG